MKQKKRVVEVLVLSDIHLGSYGCNAQELVKYLKTIKPKQVVLNGDIIDIWQFRKRYWPKSHMQVLKIIVGWLSKGVKVYYITGNHDELFRRFKGLELGTFKIVNKIILNLDGKKAWFFHGDVYDVSMKHSRWLAKIGAVGYDFLIMLNRIVNYGLKLMGQNKLSLSKKIKDGVKTVVNKASNFEHTVATIAVDKGYDFVACGHIHKPEIKDYVLKNGNVKYLNSGDWIENLTALEYTNKQWSLYQYHQDYGVDNEGAKEVLEKELIIETDTELIISLQKEFEDEVYEEVSNF